ncbi:lactate utilization protein B [Brevibacterium luteolum]|uniref:lactate utilization protein B n=1 Tax=Brevibacterium luteolum TaxID=199591 RepID=UPI00223A8F1F|nr:lactate utilization protein B [Brevibacterium luteolum]MCT1656499.1 lactate utilization protein [Brevibacterium luteolum]
MTTVNLGMPTIRHGRGNLFADEPFTSGAARDLENETLRGNLNFAMRKIRGKRAAVVSEMPDWQQLRAAGSAIKQNVLADLPELLEQFEASFTAAGGHVHWARDADEANAIALRLIQEQGVKEVNKIKSMATQETGLNEYLEAHGITAVETDLAEEIVQLGGDKPSHIVVPAIHRNRDEVRDIFLREIDGVRPDLTSEPTDLAEASRERLRAKFFDNRVAVSGANFGIAETGTLTIVESEGNGRMCLTLPDTLITFMGIEKVLPRFADLEVFLQLLPRSSTGERMNPYTSLWTGVAPGDGPQNLHVILIDNGRTATLADEVGRQALHCIRCSACLNVCPVFERAGGHAYGSVYPGPIGAILSPQMTGIEAAANNSLPYASSLCGACYEVCPVKINIPDVLVHLRGADVEARHNARRTAPEEVAVPPAADASASGVSRRARLTGAVRTGAARIAGAVARRVPDQMDALMAAAKTAFAKPGLLSIGERGLPLGKILGGRDGKISFLPGLIGGWTQHRIIDAPPAQSFRHWWKRNRTSTPARRTPEQRADVAALIAANRGKAAELQARFGAPADDYTRLMAAERAGIQHHDATGAAVADYARGTETSATTASDADDDRMKGERA